MDKKNKNKKETHQLAIMSVEKRKKVVLCEGGKKRKSTKDQQQQQKVVLKVLTCRSFFWTGFVGLQGLNMTFHDIKINNGNMRNHKQQPKKKSGGKECFLYS